MFKQVIFTLAAFVAVSSASPVPKNPYGAVTSQWSLAADGLKVDLGYGIYHGYHNSTSELNTWKGYVMLPVLTHDALLNVMQNSVCSRTAGLAAFPSAQSAAGEQTGGERHDSCTNMFSSRL